MHFCLHRIKILSCHERSQGGGGALVMIQCAFPHHLHRGLGLDSVPSIGGYAVIQVSFLGNAQKQASATWNAMRLRRRSKRKERPKQHKAGTGHLLVPASSMRVFHVFLVSLSLFRSKHPLFNSASHLHLSLRMRAS